MENVSEVSNPHGDGKIANSYLLLRQWQSGEG